MQKISTMFSLFISICISLFSLINPLSAMPVFISLTSSYPKAQLMRTVRRTSFYVLLICLISYLFGEYVLNFFGVSIHALKIAGGIIISRSGFLLLNAQHKKDVEGAVEEESRLKEDISFSPLAMPLLAGPGSISLLINLSLQTDIFADKAAVIAAILAVCIGIYVTLLSAPFILKYIGQSGLRTLSKIMGLIVLSIGIQMVVDSLRSMF